MVLLRKIFFWSFLCIYLVFCPLLVLHALGYVFSSAKPHLVRTGLAYFSSYPPGAEIYLGGNRLQRKTPTAIQKLGPGNYNIKLFLKGHKPWRHSFVIEPGKAKFFTNILLVPSNWQKQVLFEKAVREIMPLEGTDFFLVSTGNDLADYYIFNWKKQIFRSLFDQDSKFSLLHVIEIFTREKSNQIIISAANTHGKKYLLVKNLEAKPQVSEISGLFPSSPDSLDWEAGFPGYIFAFYQDRVLKLDLSNFSFDPFFLGEVNAYYLNEKWFYYFTQGKLMRISFDKSRQEEIEQNYLNLSQLKSGELYKIKILNNKVFALLSRNGHLLVVNPPLSLEENAVLGMRVCKEKGFFVYWTKNEITVVDYKHKIIKEPVYSSGSKIDQLFLANNGTHLVFKEARGVFLLEIEPRGTNHIEQVVKVKADSAIFYSKAAESLFFLDQDGANLSKIKMIERPEFQIR